MPYMSIRKIGLLLLASVLLAGCGSIATPGASLPPTLEPVTLAPRTAQDASSEGQAIAAQPTGPPTHPPLPPRPSRPRRRSHRPPRPRRRPRPFRHPGGGGRGNPDQGEILFLNGKDARRPV
jgi:uncharacterized protein YceK